MRKSYINQSKIRKIFLPVAPINEQKRIADKLDQLLARVDACRERLDRIPVFLKRFRQAVLAAATSGQLTEDWRASKGKSEIPWIATISRTDISLPVDYCRLSKQAFNITRIEHSASVLPKTWHLTTIGDLYNKKILIDFADGNHGSLYPRKEEFSYNGTLFLTATQINSNWNLDVKGCPRLREEKAKHLTKGWAINNDVLLTHNATVGRVALIENVSEKILLGTSVTFYRFNKIFINPRFSRIVFSSQFFQEQLESVMEQTTRDQVPITKQVSLNFVCPPIAEQSEIVARVEKLFAYADRLEARYRAARAQVDRLAPALLAKAFRGELVPQDPNDEPASALLERLRAERAAAPAKPRKPRGTGQARPAKSPAATPKPARPDLALDHLAALLKERGPLSPVNLMFASGLSLQDFEAQLQAEAARGLLREIPPASPDAKRQLEAV